ncbi:MAG: cell filamentation protein Fic [Gammaproteobacteria bacterium RIFCSPHIGHO2_12_FULL_41_15]|nr:MAG: cell filamentation protein Fic [Gammaproteobacteria bacterium RIFCSPHIGHO2_12_FULL_41_15]
MSLLEQVLKSITQASTRGCALIDLLSTHPNVTRRTMQRWISQLVQENKVIAEGAGRARRYYIVNTSAVEDTFPHYIPLSPDSQEILAYIDQPLMARKPTSYQRDFLDAYQPNQTWYLSEPLRLQLYNMGMIGEGNFPTGTYGRVLLNRLLIDLSWASSHLEGNTYSRLDTRKLIEYGTVAQGKAVIETQMILNHKAAIEFLIENVESIGFDRYTIFNLHSLLSENLLSNPSDEGRVRQQPVEIGKSVYRPLSIPAQISEIFDIVLNKTKIINDPFEQAFFIMVHLPYLQPFVDINKRTSRLGANIPLIQNRLCPLTFLDVSEQAYTRAILGVYEMTRIDLLRDLFVWAYERSTQEYLAIQQNVAKPSPLRLTYRDFIKETIYNIVTHPKKPPLAVIEQAITQIKKSDQYVVKSLISEELRRLHEGVLARYGLRLSEFLAWKAEQHETT